MFLCFSYKKDIKFSSIYSFKGHIESTISFLNQSESVVSKKGFNSSKFTLGEFIM